MKNTDTHAREKELSIPINKEHCNITTQSIVLISRQALRLYDDRHHNYITKANIII